MKRKSKHSLNEFDRQHTSSTRNTSMACNMSSLCIIITLLYKWRNWTKNAYTHGMMIVVRWSGRYFTVCICINARMHTKMNLKIRRQKKATSPQQKIEASKMWTTKKIMLRNGILLSDYELFALKFFSSLVFIRQCHFLSCYFEFFQMKCGQEREIEHRLAQKTFVRLKKIRMKDLDKPISYKNPNGDTHNNNKQDVVLYSFNL